MKTTKWMILLLAGTLGLSSGVLAQNHAQPSSIWYVDSVSTNFRAYHGVVSGLEGLTNIRVNQDATNEPQNETTITINPLNENNLVGGANDYRNGGSRPGFYSSTNGGIDWVDGLLPLGGGYVRGGDPAVAFDRTGKAYYTHISFDPPVLAGHDNGLFVNRSVNGGASWLSQPLTVVMNGSGGGTTPRDFFEDKPYIACDALLGSSFQNNVYVSWTRFYTDQSPSEIFISRMQAGGNSFSPPLKISDGDDVQGSVPAVGPGGVLYVAWLSYADNTLRLDRSYDGGVTFGADQIIASNVGILSRIKGQVLRANSFPSMALDNSGGPFQGYAYVVWADNRLEPLYSDVYFARGIPGPGGTLTWGAPVRLNNDPPVNGKDQWSPWITVAPNGRIHVVYYDSRDHPKNDLTDVRVATSTDGGVSFVHARINDESFSTGVGPFSGEFIGDYNGIAATSDVVFPFWTDMRDFDNNNQDVYIDLFDPFVQTIVEQKREDGSPLTGTFVGRWEGGPGFEDYPVPASFTFAVGNGEILRGSQQVVETQKYNNWNFLDNVINHHEFVVDPSLTNLSSNFKHAHSGITVRNVLDDPSINGGAIEFKDPWLIDAADQYGPRNQGSAAVFHQVPSPFNPVGNPGGTSWSYQGAFLGQLTIGGNPHYRVNALATPLSGFTWYFLGWTGTGATFSSPLNYETGVRFDQSDATVNANYKAHLGSSSSNVTGSTSQRKIIRDLSSKLQMVYESGNQIWYTWSADNGSTWHPEQCLSNSEGLTGYSHRSPSITLQEEPHALIVVWDAYIQGSPNHSVMARAIDLAAPEPDIFGLDENTLVSYSNAPFFTKPVVAFGGAGYVLCAWYDSIGQRIMGVVRNCATGTWSSTTVQLVQGIISSISLAPGNVGAQKWHLAWTQGSSLKFSLMSVSAIPSIGTIETVAQVSSVWYFEGPSLVGLGAQYTSTGVAWMEYSDEAINKYIKYRERSATGTWGTTFVWTSNGIGSSGAWFYTPTITVQFAGSYPGIVWRRGSNQIEFTKKLLSVWTKPSPIGTGIAPSTGTSFVLNSSEPVIYRGSTAPYPISKINATFNVSLAKSEGPESDPTTRTLPEGRGGAMRFDDGIAYIAIIQARRDTAPILFSALKDTAQIGNLNDFRAAATSQQFSNGGTLKLRIRYGAHGTVPSNLRFRIVLRDAQSGQQLTVVRSLLPSRDTVTTVSIPLTFTSQQIKLSVEPVGVDKPAQYEMERWYFIEDEESNELVTSTPNHMGVSLPTDFELHQNYPNPFNPSTQFSFDLPEAGSVSLAIYDVLGRQITELVNGAREAGYHSVAWNGIDQASGVYLARFSVTSGDGVQVYSKINKLILMK